jgi:hypothetical protein
MTIVAAGVATGSGSPLIGWLRGSVSISLLKHAFEHVRSGKSIDSRYCVAADVAPTCRKCGAMHDTGKA